MKKHTIRLIHFLWLLGISTSLGQTNKYIDSLQQLLPKQKGIEKIQILDELSWQLRKTKDSIGIHYALEALTLSKEVSYHKGISDAYNRLGGIAKYQGYIQQAKEYYLHALELDKTQNYIYGIARANNQLGLIYRRENNRIKALEHYLISLTAFERMKKYKQASKVSNNLGSLYLYYRANKESLEYYFKALEYSKIAGDSIWIANSYRNLGDAQKKLQNYQEALGYYQEAFSIYKKKNIPREIANTQIDIATIYDYLNKDDLAKSAFYNALNFIKKNHEGDRGTLHNNLATLYRKLNQKDSALYHYQEGVEQFKKVNSKEKLLVSYNNLGNVYYDNKEYKKALTYLNQSLAIQLRIKDSTTLDKTYSAMSKVYKELGDYSKAYKYKDSSNVITKKQFLKIKDADRYEVAYLNEKNKLETAQNQQKIAEAETEKKNAMIIGLLSVIFLLIGLFFYVIKLRKQRQQRILAEADLRQQRLISAHEKERQAQRIQELIKEKEMNAINAVIEGQEEERKRIAQDLHDNLGSKLSLVKIHYKSVEDELEGLDDETKTQYEKANQLLNEACKSVREISHNMLSGTLSNFGLIPALKELKQTIESAYNKQHEQKLIIELTSHKLDDRLENTMEIEIYRIIQELLNNIIKHAKATQVNIQLLKRDNVINILVEDDGIGFDASHKHEGFGLKTVQSRVAKMNGHCSVDSGKGNGTTITIDIPA